MSATERLVLVDGADPGLSIAAQCRLLKVARSTLYYRPVPVSMDDRGGDAADGRAFTLAYPFYGSRRSWRAALRRDGWLAKRKRIKLADAGDGAGNDTRYQKP